MEKKIFDFIEKYWWVLLAILGGILFGIWSLQVDGIKQSLSRPLSELNFEDLLILVIVHAYINKTENGK